MNHSKHKGLNNQGQLTETPGCDTIWNGIEFGNYDGYHSNLWEKFTEHFADEIAERYSQLRREGWFTVEKMMEYIYTDVIAIKHGCEYKGCHRASFAAITADRRLL